MDQQKSSGKPFDISKREVGDAWLKVKGNKGAPGVDGRPLAMFENDLKDQLYKIWKRMSSGRQRALGPGSESRGSAHR